MSRTPFLIVGDGPTEATGLGRIARDLTAQLVRDFADRLDVVQIGGSCPPPWTAWRHFPLDRAEDWGAACVKRYWTDLFGTRPGILLTVWDPGRLIDYRGLGLPAQWWAYCAVDGANRHQIISGPALDALHQVDRVLAYGRWASTILKKSLNRPTDYLPHGLLTATYTTPPTEDETAWVEARLGPYLGDATLLGMVAANQPRKDFSLFFDTIDELRRRGRHVYGWLHTDTPTKAWAVAQLVEDANLARRITLTLDELTDRQLALLYQRCGVTLLTSLGEGFGYPIVESLAAGTPVVHGDCAGGAELVPRSEWRVPVRAWRTESVYAIRRPVFQVEDWANAVERALDWRKAVGEAVCAAGCRGAVAHLDWAALWPRWASWIRSGLEGR